MRRVRVERAGADRDHTNWPILSVLRLHGYQGGSGGRGWTEVRCPFHQDRHKSAGFNQAKNIFRCQACEARGNSVTLTMQQLGMDERAAVDWLEANINGSSSATGNTGTGSNSGPSSQQGFYPLPARFRDYS